MTAMEKTLSDAHDARIVKAQLTSESMSLRFWLGIACILAILIAVLASLKIFADRRTVGSLSTEIENLRTQRAELKKDKERAEQDKGEAEGATAIAKGLTSKTEKHLASVKDELDKTESKLSTNAETLRIINAELLEIKSRLVCVMDSTSRRKMMGYICGELNFRSVLIDQEPIVVGAETSNVKSFEDQIASASETLRTQIQSIDKRHPALTIIHLHALRPAKQKSDVALKRSGGALKKTDPAANELLAALTYFQGTRDFPPTDILIYSRLPLFTKETLLTLARESELPKSVKDAVESMRDRIHAIELPENDNTSSANITALGQEVERIFDERKKRH
jgi:hypothetical protein